MLLCCCVCANKTARRAGGTRLVLHRWRAGWYQHCHSAFIAPTLVARVWQWYTVRWVNREIRQIGLNHTSRKSLPHLIQSSWSNVAGIFLYYTQIAILWCPFYSNGVSGSLFKHAMLGCSLLVCTQLLSSQEGGGHLAGASETAYWMVSTI